MHFCPDDAMITRKFSNLIMYFESAALKKIEKWLTIHGGSLGLAGRFTFDGGGWFDLQFLPEFGALRQVDWAKGL